MMESTLHKRNYWIDCLRGYAIIIVCVSHLFFVKPLHDKYPNLAVYLKGDLGVHIFYFLSGFLVVRILATEIDFAPRDKRLLALRNFWMRRLYRLQPSFIVFLIVYYLFAFDQEYHLSLISLILPISNLFEGPYETWHIKTLHIEETFYIVSGIFFLFFVRNHRAIMLTLVLVLPVIRLVRPIIADFGFLIGDGPMSYIFSFEPILWGGLMGLQMDAIVANGFYKWANRHGAAVFVAAFVGMFVVGALRYVYPISYLLFWSWPTIWAAATALMVLCFYEGESIFKNRIVHYVGIISYSLYLFQQFPLSATQTFDTFSWGQFAWISSLTAVFVVLWARYVELPLTRYGARNYPRIVRGTEPDLSDNGGLRAALAPQGDHGR